MKKYFLNEEIYENKGQMKYGNEWRNSRMDEAHVVVREEDLISSKLL
jgi:hypothetical protein